VIDRVPDVLLVDPYLDVRIDPGQQFQPWQSS
jgi:hypothetical protein